MTGTADGRPESRPWGAALLVAIVTFLVYLPALDGEFLNWDDPHHVQHNPHLRGLTARNLEWILTNREIHYVPVSWLTYVADWYVSGLDPRGCHVTNQLFHAANAALAFLLMHALLGAAGIPSVPGAAAGALVWGLHPQRVESVAWITERKDVVCGFFLLWSVLVYVTMTKAEGARRIRLLVSSVALYALCLLSKGIAMALPLGLLVLDVYPLRRTATVSWKRLLTEKAAFFLLGFGAALMAVWSSIEGQSTPAGGYTMAHRIAQPGFRLLFYAWKTLVPTDLSPMYLFRFGEPAWSLKEIGGWCAIVFATGLTIALRRRYPGLLAGWIYFAALLSPTLGWVQIGEHFATDRNTYIPSMAAGILFAALVTRWIGHPWVFRGTWVIPLVLGVLTLRQIPVWRDSISLWSRALALSDGNYVAHGGRGAALFRKGDLEGALRDFDACIRYKPDWGDAYDNRGITHQARGDLDKAIRDFTKCIRFKPLMGAAYVHRSSARLAAGDARGAADDLDACLNIKPRYVPAYVERARLWLGQGRRDEALADLDRAVALDPGNAAARFLRGIIRRDQGDLEGADAEFTAALEAEPTLAQASGFRGDIRQRRGDLAGALEDLTTALRHRPGDPEVLRLRGSVRLRLRDGSGALDDYLEALSKAPADCPWRSVVESEVQALRKGQVSR